MKPYLEIGSLQMEFFKKQSYGVGGSLIQHNLCPYKQRRDRVAHVGRQPSDDRDRDWRVCPQLRNTKDSRKHQTWGRPMEQPLP